MQPARSSLVALLDLLTERLLHGHWRGRNGRSQQAQ